MGQGFPIPTRGKGVVKRQRLPGTNPDTLSTHERQCDPPGYISRAVTVPYRSDMMA